MLRLKLIPHKELQQKELDEIIRVKRVAWPYSYEKQIEWIASNIKESDIHLLLLQKEVAVAYLNLVEIEFVVDEWLVRGFGIGNVCTSEKGRGWGKELMLQTNHYLLQNNKVGLLFCKEPLVGFYGLYQWRPVDKQKVILSTDKQIVETMIFNWDKEIQQLKFTGKPF